MMKRRFTTITTILAGVLASNTAFFATQTIAKQEMQPTMQATDRYMIIDLAGIPLDQAQNNMDAQIPADTQLTEYSSSLSEQDESEMSMELVDQSESSVSEETLPYYLSLSSVDAAKVAYFDKLDELESSLSQTDPDIAGTLTYAVSDIHAGEPMISYLLDLVLVYKCRQKKLNSLYYKKKEQRRCSTWRKIKNRILRNSSSRSSISTMPEVPHILNWNMNMA